MNITIQPQLFNKKIIAPPSKSYLQRAIAMACFSDKPCTILGYESSNDVDAAIGVARCLGKEVAIKGNQLEISGTIKVVKEITVNMSESGLCTRMFSPLLASIAEKPITINGEGSLLNRPMNKVVDLLIQLGCEATSNNGFLPIQIHSKVKLKSNKITIDASDSSQLLTGLLMAVSVLNKDNRYTIEVTNLVSKPYIAITLEVIEKFGIFIQNENYKQFTIQKSSFSNDSTFIAEGDWSGSAFLLVAGAIAGNVVIDGINQKSVQSDREILHVLELCGARTIYNKGEITCSKNYLKPFDFDASDCPDLFPPLAALASQCIGTSIIKGTNRLVHKESNRALTIQTVLTQLGIDVVLQENEMHITGGKIIGGIVSSHNDHRIAMMAAVMGLVASSNVTIEHAEAINKSYPKFYEDLGVR